MCILQAGKTAMTEWVVSVVPVVATGVMIVVQGGEAV
jgi:hypothetical protein